MKNTEKPCAQEPTKPCAVSEWEEKPSTPCIHLATGQQGPLQTLFWGRVWWLEGWVGVDSLKSEDEPGLRSWSRTELNYPKWGSGACSWEGQGGETSTRSKAEFSSQLNNLEPWRTQAGSQKSSFQTVPFAPYKVCGWAFKQNQITQHHTSIHRGSGTGSTLDVIFPRSIFYSYSHFLESPFQS